MSPVLRRAHSPQLSERLGDARAASICFVVTAEPGALFFTSSLAATAATAPVDVNFVYFLQQLRRLLRPGGGPGRASAA